MPTYYPRGTFGPNAFVGPHQGLRVTFAQTRSALTPDFVEEADFRQNIGYMVSEMETAGHVLDPASGVTVAPGELAATVDFANTGGASVVVADALADMQDALYGFFDIARRTYIRDVWLIGAGGIPWGSPIGRPAADEERNPLTWGLGLGSLALVAGVGVYLLPEIKLALRGALKARQR